MISRFVQEILSNFWTQSINIKKLNDQWLWLTTTVGLLGHNLSIR